MKKIIASISEMQKMINTALFCDRGKHNWEYYTAGNRLIKVEDGYAFCDIPTRYCKNCSRSEDKDFEGRWNLYKQEEL